MRSAMLVLVGVVFGFLAGAGVFELINRESLTAQRTAEEAKSTLASTLAAERLKTMRQLSSRDSDISRLTAELSRAKRDAEELDLALARAREAASRPPTPRTELPQQAAAPRRNSSVGNVKGGSFNVDNMSWKLDDNGRVAYQGELENLSTTAWLTTVFQVAAYNDAGDLLGTTMFISNQFPGLETKAFSWTFSDAFDVSSGVNLRFSFEGGAEDD